jgi:hypothetical protein
VRAAGEQREQASMTVIGPSTISPVSAIQIGLERVDLADDLSATYAALIV